MPGEQIVGMAVDRHPLATLVAVTRIISNLGKRAPIYDAGFSVSAGQLYRFYRRQCYRTKFNPFYNLPWACIPLVVTGRMESACSKHLQELRFFEGTGNTPAP